MLKNYSDKLDEGGKEQLHVINKMVQRMAQLVKDLLAFSKGGKAIIKKAEVNMNELVQALADEIKIANPDINYALVMQNLPPAFCDQGLITQVWTNLISNAVKYSKNNKHAVIEVGSDVVNGQQTYYVKDNGAGFDMQHACKLFSAFQRLHKQEEFEGTGVGLATAHRIITGHGGQIWAEAEVNQGATFYFSIPPRTDAGPQ
jgi:two-component system sensor histidine kinase/response regulator